jgi:hypothetical protein
MTYAVLSDGRIMYHNTTAGVFAPLTHADYVQYQAAYPDGPTMHPAFLADDDHPEDLNGEDGKDGAACEAHSGLLNPDAAVQDDDKDMQRDEDPFCDDEPAESDPFARPVNPTPSKAAGPATSACADEDSEDPTALPFRPRVLFPTPEQEKTRLQADKQHGFGPSLALTPPPEPCTPAPAPPSPENYDDDFVFTPAPSPSPPPSPSPTREAPEKPAHPTSSPYHARRSPISWTGLDRSSWGAHSYLDWAGTMGLLTEWEIETGASHGLLQRCRWVGHKAENRDWIVPAAAGVELTVTTPEGEVYWLDDLVEEYEELEAGLMQREYGHRCGEGCVGFFEEFGWELFPEAQDTGAKLVAALDEDLVVDERGEGEEEDTDGEEGNRFPWTRLETIVEGDEDAVDGGEDEDMSEVEFDMGFLDRLSDAVLVESSRLKENAVEAGRKGLEEKGGEKKELPLWMRDPTYVSGMRWSDMDDEDEDY